MTKKRVIIKETKECNIPVLKSTTCTLDNGSYVFLYEDRCSGIFAPFEGVFMVKIGVLPVNGSAGAGVKIGNVYGEAQTLYKGGVSGGSPAVVPVTLGDISLGVYMCYFDTDERRLYLVQ